MNKYKKYVGQNIKKLIWKRMVKYTEPNQNITPSNVKTPLKYFKYLLKDNLKYRFVLQDIENLQNKESFTERDIELFRFVASVATNEQFDRIWK